jgi:hypothetical protein
MVIRRTELETLQHFGVDPAVLDPGPDDVRAPGWRARVTSGSAARVRCCVCGVPAEATRLVPLPGFGPRWVDTCPAHMVAAAKYRNGQEPA